MAGEVSAAVAAASLKDRLLSRLGDRSAVNSVIGLGYVGLPLAMEFCEAGYRVLGFDVSERVVALLSRGESHIQDVPAAQVAKHVRSGRFRATTDEGDLKDADAISIAVPTPLAKTRDPDMSYVIAAAETVARRAHPGMLIVLESTTYPGTTRDVLQPRLEGKGLTIGTDVFLVFSPERVDPGNPTWHTKNTPKVLGGITPACTEVAAALYGTCIDTIVPVSSPEAAELVKLLENTFRSVNIGLVNEMSIVCDRLGVDVWEVIEAAATKPFGFLPFYPGPGIGGHCIGIDPIYLAWKMRLSGFDSRFIQLADEINRSMPAYTVELVTEALNGRRKSLNGSRILVLGVAYKRGVGDTRESPALEVISRLRRQGAEVAFADPYVPSMIIDGTAVKAVEPTEPEITSADCVVILTDHLEFDYQRIVEVAQLVVDTRSATWKIPAAKGRVLTL
jgi:UDP-N-acetyl-D-glucosamine dehydrogenase